MSWIQGGILEVTGRAVLLVLVLALALAFVRLLRGPALPDRVVALDLIATIAAGIMATYALLTRQIAVLDVAIATALVAFLGTVAFAHYLERGRRL